MPKRSRKYTQHVIIIDESEYLNAREAAKILGYGVQYVRDIARTGQLPAIKRTRKWFFCKKDVLAHLRGEKSIREKEKDVQPQGEIKDCDLLL